jgi:hypothetical protein
MTGKNHFKKIAIAALTILFFISQGYICKGSDYIEVDREFSLLTSQSLQGYLKPLFTTIEEGLNSNLFTTALYKERWSVGLDLSIMGMFIPDAQMTYNALRPEEFGNTNICQTAEYRNNQIIRNAKGENLQPTIYGGQSTAIYSAPQNFWYPDSAFKTLTYLEGHDIGFVACLPNLQLTFGLPTRTELRFRYWTIPMQGSSVNNFGFIVNQQVDHFFELFPEEYNMGIALHLAYHNISRSEGLSINSFAFGAHYSMEFLEGLTAYAALQYESMGGEFIAKREIDPNDNSLVDSPYEEVRAGKDLAIDIESFTNFRGLIGAAYQLGRVEFHFDASLASQPSLNFGIGIMFGSWGEETRTTRKVEKKEKFQRIEIIEESEETEEKEIEK